MKDWMDYWGLKGDPFVNADEPVSYNDPSPSTIIVENDTINDLRNILSDPEKYSHLTSPKDNLLINQSLPRNSQLHFPAL